MEERVKPPGKPCRCTCAGEGLEEGGGGPPVGANTGTSLTRMQSIDCFVLLEQVAVAGTYQSLGYLARPLPERILCIAMGTSTLIIPAHDQEISQGPE